MEKPLLIYDGDCGFCRHWIDRWRFVTQDQIDYAPYQEAKGCFPDISEAEFQGSIQFLTPEGERYRGAEAVFQAIAIHPNLRWPLRLYQSVSGLAYMAEVAYQIVAEKRSFFSKGTRWLSGTVSGRPTMTLTRDLFLSGLGLIYAIAFASLGVQILGLVGSHGILPVEKYLLAVTEQVGTERYWQFPTLFWLGAGDHFLQIVCWAGVVMAGFVVAGFHSGLLFFFLWFLYLSLMKIARLFMGYQWDILLLETGFLAILMAPYFWLPRRSYEESSFFIVFLFRLLLFKLMFSTGVVKITSNDPNWHDLTALNYHYFTQPLPTWLGWYAHHLPTEIQKFSVASIFFVQLLLPFMIFGPRRLRIIYFYIHAGLQGLIALTGNYGFLNLLTVLWGFFLLDDIHLRLWLPKEWVDRFVSKARCSHLKGIRKVTFSFGFVVLVYLNLLQILFLFKSPALVPRTLMSPLVLSQSVHLVNRYGLFAVMTTSRPEVIIEGSQDLKTWKPYEFRWKAGNLNRTPSFVAPHQPRLDWQMWFAALGHYKNNIWLVSFLMRLAEGSETVTSLIKHNPFSGNPPKYVRAMLYQYQFTTPEERKQTGAWWKRELLGPYTPLLKRPTQ